MATIKSYTDLSQSKKLAEFLPLESADNSYMRVVIAGDIFNIPEEMQYKHNEIPFILCNGVRIPCWSLAALLGVLPSRLFDSTPKRKELYLLPDLDKSYCFYRQFAVKTKGKIYLLTEGVCLVDACVAMIEKLHELKML